jgi:hypothetical protein
MRRTLFTALLCCAAIASVDYRATSALAAIEAATPAPATPTPTPVFGDLRHLEATESTKLHAELVDPIDGAASLGSSTSIEVTTGLGQIPDLRVNDEAIGYVHLGRRTIDKSTATVSYTYYGVALSAGPNSIELRALGANGTASGTTRAVIFGPGDPATLRTSIEGKPVADGKSAFTLRVAAIDRWGHPAAAGSSLSVALVGGDVQLFIPAAGDHPRTQSGRSSVELILARGGSGIVSLVPGLKAGDVQLRVATSGLSSDVRFFLAPYVRAPLVTGLVTAGLGSVPGVPGDASSVPNGVDSRRGRIAVYATGGVGGGALATVAYDSADSLQPSTVAGAFVDDPNERPYATSGDASIRRDDALSRDRLYARIELGRSSLSWGEFQADTGSAESLGGFNLLLQGANLQLANKATKVGLFRASNDVAYGRLVLAPTGLATLATELHPNIVIGSDFVSLVALDRRTGAVLTQTTLVRNVDYTLDYGTGALRFITIPMPFDQHLNPQQLLVQYEYASPGSSSRTTGGRVESALGAGQGVHVGLDYINDDSGAGSLTLAGQDVHGGLNGGQWSLAHLSTSGALPSQGLGLGAGLALAAASGDAYRAELTDAHAADRFSLLFEATSSGYDNPFGGLSSPGLIDERIDYERDIDRSHDRIEFSFDHIQNSGPAGTSSQSDATLSARHHLGSRVTATASLIGLATDAVSAPAVVPVPGVTAAPTAPAAGTTLAADFGLEWKPSSRLTFALDRRLDVAGPAQSDEPGQTLAQVSLALPGSGTAYVRQLWSDQPTSSFASSTQSLTVPVLGTRATTFGFERAFGNATVSTDYAVQQTANGTDITSAFGVREKLVLGKYLRGDAFVQNGASAGATGASFIVYGLTLAYADPSGRMRANGSYQERSGDGAGDTLLLGGAGALSPVLSVLGTIASSRSDGLGSDDVRTGFAYRPATDDRSVSLLEYEQADDATETLPSHGATLSFEQLLRPLATLEIVGRYAYKLDGDTYYAAHSSLLGLRLTQRFGARNDFAIEASRLQSAGLDGIATTGLALETGYRIASSFRVAAGYSFEGSADPALTAAPTRRGLYVTATSVLDNLLGWGRRQ